MFLASDASYTQGVVLQRADDGVAGDARAALEAFRRIREFARQRPVVYLPSHDPEAGSRPDTRRTVAS